MRIAEYVEPGQDRLAELLAQAGVREVTTTMVHAGGHGTSSTWAAALRGDEPWDVVPLRLAQQWFAEHGLRVAVVEDTPPLDGIRLGLPTRDAELQAFLTQIRSMGELEIGVLCFNFMAVSGWARTSVNVRGRGGALVSSFDRQLVAGAGAPGGIEPVPAQRLWESLEWLLERAVPVAEDAGVKLALHPDDPPLPDLRGIARIAASLDDLERAVRLVASPAFGITFCQGNIALMTDDVPAAIHRFADLGAIHFVHFRDVRGTPEAFVETFHDEGPTDMAACMRAYLERGVDVPVRSDHVPTLEGDSNERPGYSTLGRLWAVGYMAGLLEAARS